MHHDLRDGGLYRLKPLTARTSDRALDRLATAGVRPDVLTLANLLAAVGAAACVGAVAVTTWSHADGLTGIDRPRDLVLGPALAALPLGLLRLLLAVWDGELARRTGTTSARGAVRGELADMAGDAVLLLALVPLEPVAALAAVAVAVAADAVAAVTWAVTGRRGFAGVGGKPDRTLLVVLGAPAVLLAPDRGSWLVWAALLLVLVNLVWRLRAALRSAAAHDGRGGAA